MQFKKPTRREFLMNLCSTAAGAGIATAYLTLKKQERDWWQDIEKTITENNFKLYSSNTQENQKPQLLVLGDIHGICNDEHSAIIDKAILGWTGKLFVEDAHTNIGPRNYETAFEYFGTGEIGELDPRHLLATKRKGTIIGVDTNTSARDELRSKFLYSEVLPMAQRGIERGKAHPFCQWLVYDDLQLTSREQNKAEQSRAVGNYISTLPTFENLLKQTSDTREIEIAKNIGNELRYPSRPAVLTIGNYHVTEGILLDELAKNGVVFKAYVPANEDKLYRPTFKPAETAKTHADRFSTDFITHYIELRERAGRPPYTGSLDELIK